MSTYFAKAKATAMGGGERVVGVTGQLGNGLLRVVDVDIRGNPIGDPSYIPANSIIHELYLDSSGYLVDSIADESQEIDWAAHEVTETGATTDEAPGEDDSVISDGRVNPAMAAFPELQGD